MQKLDFRQINTENRNSFDALMRAYIKELDEHQNNVTSDDFLTKWIDGIISIQGDSDRHLEYCYDNDMLVGFLYGKIDHSEHKGFKKVGFGYIMEFYVLPEHRRKGYGEEMFLHLEELFRKDGAKRMYLTSDPVTGKPFWEAMGFISTGEQSPENNQEIYEKKISDELITITVSEYLTQSIAENLAQAQWERPDWAGHIIRQLDEYKAQADCFNVIAQNEQGEIVGRLFCLQNKDNKKLWYYGDLFVVPECRRRHIADRMLAAAEQALSERRCCTLRCYVEPENTPSLLLQKKNGFEEKPYEQFNDLENEGQLMFEKKLFVHDVNNTGI